MRQKIATVSTRASTRTKGSPAVRRRSLKARTRGSRPAHSALTVDFENEAPHKVSVTSVTLRVETPCTTISINASTKACSLRWARLNISGEKLPSRGLGYLQGDRPHAAVQGPGTHAIAIALTLGAALMRPGTQVFCHLRLQHLVQDRPPSFASPSGPFSNPGNISRPARTWAQDSTRDAYILPSAPATSVGASRPSGLTNTTHLLYCPW